MVGSFLGRDVRVATADATYPVEVDAGLTSSLVLLVLGASFAETHEKEALLGEILRSRPLAMVFFGLGNYVAFDLALRLQSKMRDCPHTMTKASTATDLGDALEDFLHATWPAEERFGEWKTYSVLVVGDETLSSEVQEAIVGVLHHGA